MSKMTMHIADPDPMVTVTLSVEVRKSDLESWRDSSDLCAELARKFSLEIMSGDSNAYTALRSISARS